VIHRKIPKGDAWRSFPERLARARAASGLSRVELARRSGVATSLLSRLENYPRPWVAAETLLRLSQTLSVRPHWLWFGVGPQSVEELRCLENEPVLDATVTEILGQAISQAPRPYHAMTVATARTFAVRGERHTAAGWRARLDEIQGVLAPLVGD